MQSATIKKQFFTLLDNYLIGDLETMVIEIGRRESGGLGYPAMQTILSGMELLGMVLSAGKKKNRQAFYFFWDNFLAINKPKYDSTRLKKIFRFSVRNGTAHYFLTNFNIRLTKENRGNLTKTVKKELNIDIVAFYTDFKSVYKNIKNRLYNNQDDELNRQFAEGYRHLLKELQATEKDIEKYIEDAPDFPRRKLTTGESRLNINNPQLTTSTSSQGIINSNASVTRLPIETIDE